MNVDSATHSIAANYGWKLGELLSCCQLWMGIGRYIRLRPVMNGDWANRSLAAGYDCKLRESHKSHRICQINFLSARLRL
jgi:hypothetical protein